MIDREVGLKGNGLLGKALAGKSIFIVWRRYKGSISSENETRDLQVMGEQVN